MPLFTFTRRPPIAPIAPIVPPAPPAPPSPPPSPRAYAPAYPTTPRPKKSWLRRKLLLFEVTFCPYLMTPIEKWAFYTFLLLFLGLFAAAVTLYLPQHVQTVVRRAYFYVIGDDSVIRKRDVLGYSTFDADGGASMAEYADSIEDGIEAAISMGKEELKSYMQS
ncbi:hypothetical protein ABW21_db0206664 [Orbilia brochopaga]|nr:hypothetical protein ABW21_db0206664 [Drechslerella brochopaga]